MSVSLYDFSVANFVQGLEAVAGLLEKGRAHMDASGASLDDLVQMRLIDDMNPFQFQVISVAHHSMGALKGVAAGEFAPPAGYGEPDFDGLEALVKESLSVVQGFDRDTVDGFVGKTVTFKLGGHELPFTAENFLASFSLPNFYFHATTTYDILRMQGVSIGKRDYMGAMRMGA